MVIPIVVSSRNALDEIRSKEIMASAISSRLGRTTAVADEGEKRSRCPSKRRGRRPSLRSNTGPEIDAVPKNLISSVDDEDQSDEEEALLFSKDRSSNSRSSNNGTDRRGAKHVKSPGVRQPIRKVRSANGPLQSPQAAASSKLRGSGNRRSLNNVDGLRSPKLRANPSPNKDGVSKRASRSASPSAGSSRRGVRSIHAGSDDTKGRASRHSCSGKVKSPQKLKPVAKLDDSDSDDDGMPLSYLGGIHKQQGHLKSGLDDVVDFASDYSSATEDEASGLDDEDGAHRERGKRGSSRRQRRASHSGGVRQQSIRKMLPTDDSETANDDDEEEKHEKHERRKKPHSPSKKSPSKRAGRSKVGRPDALQFSPSNRRASYSDEISQNRRHNNMLPGADDTETEVDDTENGGDDEQNIPGNRRHRTRLSMDVLRADILHKQRTESEGKKPTVDDKRIEADMAHAMQRLEAHDAEASKKKKKRFGQLMGMFKKSDTSESGYESTASTSSARDPSRGLARHRSRLVKNALPHTLLNDNSDSERQEVDFFLATK